MELTAQTEADILSLLDRTILDQNDYDLALANAPVILFDEAEPFLPSVVGYTVFRTEDDSPSFPRQIKLPQDAVCAIEYAIWWDWDIQHLYELEHAWVYLDPDGNLVDAEASWHGGYSRMVDEGGSIPTRDGRLLLHSEPGKHAFAPSPQRLVERKPITDSSCTSLRGFRAVLVTPLFEGIIRENTPNNNQLVHSYLEGQLFEPTYKFTKNFPLEQAAFVTWGSLNEWIPQRVSWWVAELERTIPPAERRALRIAHRGASAYAQENSPEALQAAADLGSDMVEVDVRITADDVPVVSHDESLKRVYGIDGLISELTLSELKEKAPLMTFDELIQECRKLGLGLYLDIKSLNPAAAQRMFSVLDETGFWKFVIFASFRVDLVAEIKGYRPDVLTSILFGSTHVDPVPLAKAVNADFVHPCWERSAEQPHQLLTPQWISAVREAGLGIITWHEERPDEIAALKALGVNGICSDQPELLL